MVVHEPFRVIDVGGGATPGCRGADVDTPSAAGAHVPVSRLLDRLPLLGTARRRAEDDGCGRTLVLALPFLDSEHHAELRVPQHVAHGSSSGLVFQPLALRSQDVAALAVSHPVVALGERVFDGPVDHVTTPHAEAAETAVRHLLSTGRRRIAAVGPREGRAPVAALRAEGCATALQEADIAVDPALVIEVRGWGPDDGAAAVDRLVRDGTPFDAVFAVADSLALGVLHALARNGRRVPDDVAVVGVDDVRSARSTHPTLTTVDAGTRAVAHSAVSLLDERICGGRTGGPRRFTTLHRLVVRESS